VIAGVMECVLQCDRVCSVVKALLDGARYYSMV